MNEILKNKLLAKINKGMREKLKLSRLGFVRRVHKGNGTT